MRYASDLFIVFSLSHDTFSPQERRICVQLLQNRHEKLTITKNRCLQEKRFEIERMREFEEAMDRESVGPLIRF